jgi:hypothetical protein
MSAQQKLAYVSLWAKQDLDETSPVIATGKLNLVDKSVEPFNVSLFRDKETGKSTLRLSSLGKDNKWTNHGTLVVEQKVKGNMVAYATGRFNDDDVVVFLFDNSEKQQVNSKAPDYTGTMYFDEKKESRVGLTKTNKPVIF